MHKSATKPNLQSKDASKLDLMSRLAKGRAFKVDQKEMKMRSKKYFDKLPENKEKKEKERILKEAQERKDRIA